MLKHGDVTVRRLILFRERLEMNRVWSRAHIANIRGSTLTYSLRVKTGPLLAHATMSPDRTYRMRVRFRDLAGYRR